MVLKDQEKGFSVLTGGKFQRNKQLLGHLFLLLCHSFTRARAGSMPLGKQCRSTPKFDCKFDSFEKNRGVFRGLIIGGVGLNRWICTENVTVKTDVVQQELYGPVASWMRYPIILLMLHLAVKS